MDTDTLYLIIAIPVFFFLLHLAVIPLFQKISVAVQGEPFAYRLQAGEKSKASKKVAKWDILWSALAFMVALTLTGLVLILLGELDVIPKIPSGKK